MNAQKKHKPEGIVANLEKLILIGEAQRVERIWREGPKVPRKQPKKGRLWLNDGSCGRLRPEHPNHVWSYDFVEGRTHKWQQVPHAQYHRRVHPGCLAIRIGRKLNSTDVIDAPSDLFILRGVPSMFVPTTVRNSSPRPCGNASWLSAQGPPSSSREARGRTATARASTRKLRDELLNGEIFYSLAKAKVIIEAWRRYYNTERPHSSLRYKPPAPEAIIWPASPHGSAPPSAQAMAEKPIMY